ncbi:fimbrial assembly protein [Cellulomonas sp. S1-8]|uniref:fimbrial assembly protein n=1 Tax=Cellulomonas sp. S1-8 TaxID=2904790 RepID=UPI00224465B3|nr:fimbrial assembly protein [Cellulomonas sp. S1-8]UZN05165.1 fimbrial assembly protein [Cellulomonas sp. S1-8]
MSTVLSRPLAAKKSRATGFPSVPQVNLLPPEYGARQALSQMKRRLLFVLVVVLAAAVVAYGVALTSLTSARGDQARAEGETTRLLQAQQQYAEVPQVLGQLTRAQDAQALGMSTEILWAPYLRAIGAVMPEGVLLSQFAMTGATPMLAPAPPSNVLQEPTVAGVAFEAISDELVDTAAWVDALNAMPGFHGALVSSASADEYNDQPVYRYTSTVRVTEAAYADRFAEGE